MRNRVRLAVLSTALLVGTIGLATAETAQAQTVDRVVAVVEDEAIFLSDVEHRLQPFVSEIDRLPNARVRAEERERLYRETLDRMVDDALIRRAAQRAHVTVDETDVDRMIEGIARTRGLAVGEIYAAVEREGISRGEYRSYMQSEVLRLRLMNVRVRGRVNVSEAEIVDEYRRRMREAADHAPFHVAHIFFAFPDAPTGAQIAETRRRAEEAVARLESGANFAELASQLSDDTTTRTRGGDLGTIDPTLVDAAPPEWLVDALRGLRPGETSVPVRGENGYHVFRLIERQGVEVAPLAEARTEVANALMQREMEREQRVYLRELRERSSVVVRP